MRKQQRQRQPVRLKPLLITLGCVGVMALSLFAPQLALRAQDTALTGGFNPVEQRGGVLSYDEKYYYAGAAIAAGTYGYIMEEEYYYEGEQTLVLYTRLQTQIEQMISAGLLTGDYLDYLLLLNEYYGGTFVGSYTFESGGYELGYASIAYPSHYYGGNQYYDDICYFWMDEATGKLLRGTFSAPYATQLGENFREDPQNTLETLIYRYISWMELHEITDWTIEDMDIYENSYYYYGYSYAYSVEANIYLGLNIEISNNDYTYLSLYTGSYR